MFCATQIAFNTPVCDAETLFRRYPRFTPANACVWHGVYRCRCGVSNADVRLHTQRNYFESNTLKQHAITVSGNMSHLDGVWQSLPSFETITCCFTSVFLHYTVILIKCKWLLNRVSSSSIWILLLQRTIVGLLVN